MWNPPIASLQTHMSGRQGYGAESPYKSDLNLKSLLVLAFLWTSRGRLSKWAQETRIASWRTVKDASKWSRNHSPSTLIANEPRLLVRKRKLIVKLNWRLSWRSQLPGIKARSAEETSQNLTRKSTQIYEDFWTRKHPNLNYRFKKNYPRSHKTIRPIVICPNRLF